MNAPRHDGPAVVATGPFQATQATILHGPEELVSNAGTLLDAWSAGDLDGTIRIEFSLRMTRSLGITYPQRQLIRLSTALKAEPVLLREVLCHELAHLVVHFRYGKAARPHGPEWRALMRAAGFEPRVRLEAPDPVRARMRPKRGFLHRCPVCRAERAASRRMLHWRCGRCVRKGRPGRLVVEALNR